MFILQKPLSTPNLSPRRSTLQSSNWGRLVIAENPVTKGIQIPVLTKSDTETEVVNPGLIQEKEDNILVVTLDSGVDNLVSIKVDHLLYQLTNESPPAPGFFNYNPLNFVATIALFRPSRRPVVVINSTKSNYSLAELTPVRKNSICRIDAGSLGILSSYNAQAQITLSRRFSDHASLAFTFSACKNQESKILRELYNGREFFALGLRWVIDGITVQKQDSNNQLAFSIACKDFLASRGNPSTSVLDRRVFIRSAAYLNADQAGNKGYIGTVAKNAGVVYRGTDISFRIPRNTSSEETTTVRDLISNRAIATGGFPFYTNGQGVENRNWFSTATHVIRSDQVKTKTVQYNYQGHGSLAGDNVRLHTEYRNLEVNLDFDADSQDGYTGTTTRWVFENCRDYGDMVTPNEYKGWYYQAPKPEVLRSPGNCFDNGGTVKSATKIIEMNGTPVWEEHFEYGYAFSTAETYRARPTPNGNYIVEFKEESPDKYWKEVKHTTTDYIYNEEGYLSRIKITGKSLARLQQESEKKEAIALYTKAVASPVRDGGGITGPDPSLLAQSEAYKFTETLPINDFTVYELEKHRDYFEDTVKPGDACNKLWVEPKFVKSMTRNLNESILKDNPASSESLTLPPIVTGHFLRETETIAITSTQFPYKYEKRNFSQNSEGEYFKNTIALGGATQNTGKPGVATRLDKSVVRPNPRDRAVYQAYRNSRFFLSSPGVTGVNTSEGSKGYPDIDDPIRVREIAATELSITNTQNALTTQIDIDWRSGIEEGDFAIFNGSRWKILAIEENINITQGELTSDRLTLSLGYYLTPGVNVNSRNHCSGGLAAQTAAAIASLPVVLGTGGASGIEPLRLTLGSIVLDSENKR